MSTPRHVYEVPFVPSSLPTFVRPTGPADSELEWFFTMAESSLGHRSNFLASLVIEEQRHDESDDRFEAARAQRVIYGRLRNLGDPHAGVLEVAYAARRWPLPLRVHLGRLTGILVRLGAAEVGLPDDDRALAALEEDVAGAFNEMLVTGNGDDIAPFREVAQHHFDLAYGGYRRVRNDGPSVVGVFG